MEKLLDFWRDLLRIFIAACVVWAASTLNKVATSVQLNEQRLGWLERRVELLESSGRKERAGVSLSQLPPQRFSVSPDAAAIAERFADQGAALNVTGRD